MATPRCGWAGVALYLFSCVIAVMQLEAVDYVEHYGLTRKYLGDGKYEHVKPRHSWDAAHLVTNLILINLTLTLQSLISEPEKLS